MNIESYNGMNFNKLGTMLDCSRGAVMTVEAVKKWIDITADLGYNTLMLYTEDTYEVDGHPYFGYLRGKYTKNELQEIDNYAFEKGMELIPCIQTLAHLEAIFRWPQYDEIKDCDNILLVGNEKTYELIDAMFASVKKCFRSNVVNIGMDEAHMLGRGKYQDINGFEDRFDILLRHLKRVSDISKKYGFELIMWGDMFFRLLGVGYGFSEKTPPETITAMIPDNVNLVYWDYYSKSYDNYNARIKTHSTVKENIWFAGGLWTWGGFASHNQYSMDTTKAALTACRDNGVKNVFLTMWGDDGAECSKFALLPSLYYAAQLAKGVDDIETIKRGFEQKFGIAFDDYMLLDLPDTPNDDKDMCDPETYMLYNDCFLGVYDPTVRKGAAHKYALCSQKLKEFEDNKDYGYLFKTLRTLCDVLGVKYELGVKTRQNYLSGNKNGLKKLIDDYDSLIELVDAFYNSFCKQWFKENKPNGFEMHDVRIGGLIHRIKHCRNRIDSYIKGEINSISELEEPLLDPRGYGTEFKDSADYFKSWARSAIIDEIY